MNDRADLHFHRPTTARVRSFIRALDTLEIPIELMPEQRSLQKWAGDKMYWPANFLLVAESLRLLVLLIDSDNASQLTSSESLARAEVLLDRVPDADAVLLVLMDAAEMQSVIVTPYGRRGALLSDGTRRNYAQAWSSPNSLRSTLQDFLRPIDIHWDPVQPIQSKEASQIIDVRDRVRELLIEYLGEIHAEGSRARGAAKTEAFEAMGHDDVDFALTLAFESLARTDQPEDAEIVQRIVHRAKQR